MSNANLIYRSILSAIVILLLTSPSKSSDLSLDKFDVDLKIHYRLPNNTWLTSEPINNMGSDEEYIIQKRHFLQKNKSILAIDLWNISESVTIDDWLQEYSYYLNIVDSQSSASTFKYSNKVLKIFFQEYPQYNYDEISIYWEEGSKVYRVLYISRDNHLYIKEVRELLLSLRDQKGNVIFESLPDAFRNIEGNEKREADSQDCCGYHDPNPNYFSCYGCGNCTWWSLYSRPDLNGVVTGNASQWLSQAQGAGRPTGSTPEVDSICCDNDFGGYGHVSYVIQVVGDGAKVTEMWYPDGCENVCCQVCDWRTYSSSQVNGFIYGEGDRYSCQYHSQNPNDEHGMNPDQIETFTIRFSNTGTDTWVPGSGDHNVKLVSCSENGAQVPSCMYPGSGHGWESGEVVKQISITVSPGAVAEFSFDAKAPSTPGVYRVYFRLWHSTAGLLPGWGGAHFYIYVPFSGSYCPCQ